MSSVDQRARELVRDATHPWATEAVVKVHVARAVMETLVAAALREQPEARGVVDDAARMDWLERHNVEVREPLLYGSRGMFHAQQISDDDEPYRNGLRAQIDTHLTAAQQPVQEGGRNPLLAYADSYRTMAKLGDGRVDCLSVAVDIERNMAPHAQTAPPSAPVGVPDGCVLVLRSRIQALADVLDADGDEWAVATEMREWLATPPGDDAAGGG